MSETYCDGLGACLPECPAGAITIEEREASAFDEKAVTERIHKKHNADKPEPLACGCPGSHSRAIGRGGGVDSVLQHQTSHTVKSQLRQWPVQMKLVPPGAPYFDNAHLLVAADCTAYAYAGMHQDFMHNKVTLIGCPKLDDADYGEKLAHILATHEIKSVTVLRMEVPCCGGLVGMVKHALVSSGKMIPWRVVVISAEGDILEE